MTDKVFSIPIVYGSVASTLSENDERRINLQHSHEWTVYLRSGNGKDISWLFEKIQFNLHESFANPKRVFSEPPFAVTETGWGEFEIIIKLFFWQNSEKSVTLHHHLKLFHPITDSSIVTETSKQPIISEKYDELIFTEPLETLFQRFQEFKDKEDLFSHNHPFNKQLELKEMSTILDGLEKVRDQIETWRQKHDKLREEVTIYRQNKKSVAVVGNTLSTESVDNSIAGKSPLTANSKNVVDDDDEDPFGRLEGSMEQEKKKRRLTKDGTFSVKKKLKKIANT